MANESTSLSTLLEQKLVNVETALPVGFNKTRFCQNAMALLNSNPAYKKYPPAELIQGLVKGAYLGLDFMSKECYLIPYGNQLNFQTDYKGEIKFVKKYSIRPIKDIYAKCVREGDDFIEKIVDGAPSIDFRPLPFNGGDIVGVFAVCLFEDGGLVYETMSVKEVQAVRNNYSKAAQSSAWKNSFDEMAKKVVLRRLCKHINVDMESVEMAKAWDDASGMEFEAKVKYNKDSASTSFADKVAEEITSEEVINVEAVEVVTDAE